MFCGVERGCRCGSWEVRSWFLLRGFRAWTVDSISITKIAYHTRICRSLQCEDDVLYK